MLSGARLDGSQQKPAATPTVIRLPPGWQLNRMPRLLPPDGKRVVYCSNRSGRSEVYAEQ
jgi:Tol biopolymer transport system component